MSSSAATSRGGPAALRPALPVDRAPRWDVGTGAWDTHAHVFGPPARFPLRPDRRYTPPTQDTDRYLATLDGLGIAYGVLVQPSVYAQDNSCLLHALDTVPDRFVGVVDVDVVHADDRELSDMTGRGVRGLRVFWTSRSSLPTLRTQADRLRDLGWHLDLHLEDVDAMCELAEPLATLGVPVMVEGMGSPHSDDPYGSRGFAALLDLLAETDTWVKLSHAYHTDPDGPPYDRSARFARSLVEAVPGRAVWGSDWPHPMGSGVMPRDADLVDLVLDWTGDAALARAVMCDNPARFYGGPPGSVPQH